MFPEHAKSMDKAIQCTIHMSDAIKISEQNIKEAHKRIRERNIVYKK